MKGLLLKEGYRALYDCRNFAFICLLFLVIGVAIPENGFFLFYPSAFAGMMPLSLMAYDERDRWTQYSQVLPYSAKQLVGAKYLFGLIAQGGMIVLTLIAMAVTGQQSDLGSTAMLLMILSSIAPAIGFPFYFRYGTEKGRYMYYALIVLLMIVYRIMSDGQLPSTLQASLPLVLVATLLLMALSYRLSVIFYQAKKS